MDELGKMERLLKMLVLLSSGRSYTIEELSNRFCISDSTVHRYISLLRNVGFILPRPVNGRYYIEKTSPRFKEMSQLLHFSEEEAYILSKAIHAIDDVNILKINLVHKLYSLYDFDRVAVTVVKRENCENVHKIIQAIKQKKQVLLKSYQSAHSDMICDRLIEPFEFTTNYISVWGFEPGSRMNKTFKTSRISNVELLSRRWEYEDQHKTEPVDVFRISGQPVGNVKLLLSIRARNLLSEEYPLAEKYIRQVDETHYLFETPVSGWDGVGRFVLGLCNEIKILAPQELKEFIVEKVKKFIPRKKNVRS
jgi:predicted DNA-binding transcriptional regulator YafY